MLSSALFGCGDATTAPASSNAQPSPTATSDVATAPTTGPTASEAAAGAQATAVSVAAASSGVAREAAMTSYRTRTGIALQEYANALGALRERDREVGERPALVGDAAWLGRTRTALQLMQSSADRLTAIETIPPEMARTATLIRQIHGETQTINQEYGRGIQDAAPASLAAAGNRTTLVLALLGEANRELRRGQGA